MTYYVSYKFPFFDEDECIDREEYVQLREARDQLLALVLIEETWDILVANYVELELEIIKSAMEAKIYGLDVIQRLDDTRLLYGRRFSNLLSSCRSYVDHTSKHLKVFKSIDARERFSALKSAEYDSVMSYRLMEVLRNHAQHHGIPIHGSFVSMSWEDIDTDDGRMRIAAAGVIHKAKILEDADLRKKLENDITNLPEEIHVSPFLRQYLESLASVHLEMRKILANDESRAIERISAFLECWQFDEETKDLRVYVGKSGSENEVERFALSDALFKRLDMFRNKNGSLVNLRKRQVSSGPIKKSR